MNKYFVKYVVKNVFINKVLRLNNLNLTFIVKQD